MRLFVVTPELPLPPYTGAYARPMAMLSAAARTHEVVLVGTAPADADLSALHALCIDVHVVPEAPIRRGRRSAASAGRRLVTPVPLVTEGRSRAVRAVVEHVAADWEPDAMLVETLYAAHYRLPDVPLIVDLPELPSGLYESAATAGLVRHLAANLQAATSRRYARRLLEGSVPVTINEDDRTRLATMGVESYTVPLPVDLAPAEAVRRRAAGARHDVAVHLLFVGSFRHALNRDAARFLVERLAPELRAARTPFALVIAGRHAPAWLRKAAGAGVSVISDAPDLEPLYASADVVVAPLPHGGGTKYKTLEAMAWGLPVVGTPQAFTGLPQLDGQAFVCEGLDAAILAQRIRQLAEDPETRLRIGDVARDYVATAHSPELATKRTAALLDAVGAGGGIRDAEALFREHEA